MSEDVMAECAKCGMSYSDPACVDAVIPGEIWEQINSSDEPGAARVERDY